MKHLFLIDGSGFIFRAYHALPPMTRPDGTPVGAVYGFTKMIMKLVEETDADAIAVVLDRARKTFRSDIYPEYKSHRPPPPDDLIPQFALVRDAVEAMDLASVDMEGYEADDLIATYAMQARERGAEVTIVSSDKDLMQLIGPGITMMDAMKNKIIGPDEVFEKFGVGPDRVIDVQALAGDSSDNIPGVEGIGVKTAALLINEYGDLDGVLANAKNIKQNKRREKLIEQADKARISRQLVTLKKDVPIEKTIDDFILRKPDPDKIMSFLYEQDFKSLIKKFEAQGLSVPAKAKNTSIDKKTKPGKESPKQISRPAPIRPTEKVYELIQDEKTLKSWVAGAMDAGVVAVDSETTALDSMAAKLVGISLSYQPGKAAYIPLAHRGAPAQGAFDLGDGNSDGNKDAGAPKQIDSKIALKILKPLLEDPGVLKVGQNIKYDKVVLARSGVEITPVDDTMVISYVLEGGMHGHGMDELALTHLGVETIKFKDVTGSGKSKVTFDYVALDKALDYAAEDADITLQLHQLLKPRLVDEHMVSVYETIERPLIQILVDMEMHGIKVDAKILKKLSDDFAKRLGVLESDIHKIAGREFNIASPKQLGEILFDELGLEGGKKNKKSGTWSTDAEVLEELSHVHELPAHVLNWRQLAKLKSTYTDALQNQINPDTGRVHTSYSMAATSTGRLASSDPNLQNIPIRTEEGRAVRTAFIAEKGNVLLSADYSQIELRLLAHVAGIDALKEAFHSGLDIHAMTASQVFGVPVEGMDPDIRRKAKAINFGIIYGISAFGLARQLGISRGEAKQYIDAYFERFPGILDYMETTKKQAARDGFVSTLYGRKCFVPGINDKNQMRRSFAERAAINAPIQGGAADIIKRAMILLPDALNNVGLSAKMLLQVHDELVFELPKAESEKTIKLVKTIMEGAASLDVPLVVDVGVGGNWGQAH
ncbi:MAG: DNA polymerase I [Rhodospirillaceae bacterium]|nr:DNA polymerase I [Rhodospirillaceae bacterium]MDH5771776.1 DNA polymerase I [Rhodospirillaceae bacterium]